MVLKNRTFYALSKQDKVLHLCGVPTSYLKKLISPQQLHFELVSLTHTKPTLTITPQEQQKLFFDLLQNLDCIGQSALYGIGSYPTDQAAYQLATILTKNYYEYALKQANYFPNIKWIDIARPDWDFLKSSEKCELLFVHGLSHNSDVRRLELTRDYIHKADGATIFIMSLASNICNFFIQNLGISPEGIFQLTKTINRVLI